MGSLWRFQILAVLIGLLPATGYASTITFSNATSISIPAFGNATPYPSTITVTGMGPIVDLSVSLINFSHSHPEDVGVLLVGPSGIVNANLTFADGGALWPNIGSVASGTFQPRSYFSNDSFPAPAPIIAGVNPTTSGAKSFSVFNGSNPNGVWSLFVRDFALIDSGTIAGGFSLTITDEPISSVPEPNTLLLLSGGFAALGLRRRLIRQ
jgi:PEP-CTERM motif